MKDALFIEHQLQRLEEVEKILLHEFSNLTLVSLNWKPSSESWSIAQCFDHLIVSDSLFFPDFKRIAEGTFKMSALEKASPFSHFFGKMMKNYVTEKVKRKIKAPKKFLPSEEDIDAEIILRYTQHVRQLKEYFSSFRNLDIDSLVIESRVSWFITYTLRHTVEIIVQHEHRHLIQALKEKKVKEFPAQVTS